MKNPYSEGYQAFYDNDKCPYDEDSEAAAVWADGWNHAEEDMEEKKNITVDDVSTVP